MTRDAGLCNASDAKTRCLRRHFRAPFVVQTVFQGSPVAKRCKEVKLEGERSLVQIKVTSCGVRRIGQPHHLGICATSAKARRKLEATHCLVSQTASELLVWRLVAHHSARLLIQASLFWSPERLLQAKQNLKSSHLALQSNEAWPSRYKL
jgi:hypothetical protein